MTREPGTAPAPWGTPPDRRVITEWPGLDATSVTAGFSYDGAKMSAAAEHLRKQAEQITNAVSALSKVAGVFPCGPDSWLEASTLRTASVNTAATVVTYGKQMAENLRAGADAIEASLESYRQADRSSEDTNRAVQGNLPGAGGNR